MIPLGKKKVEISFAPCIYEIKVQYFDGLITKHLVLFRKIFLDTNIPEHHFVQHYPDMIKKFGPLVKCYTIQFEGKHSYFTTVIKQVHCFENISKVKDNVSWFV